MNPSQCTPVEPLFGACIHAGGWPKMGWQAAEATDLADEVMTCYDDIVLL